MNRIILTIVGVMLAVGVWGQEFSVKPFELEFGAGMSAPLESYRGGTIKPGGMFEVGLRYNFDEKPWDCGIFLMLDCARRDFDHRPDFNNYQNNRTAAFGVEGGYNFFQGATVNPYVSAGLGVAKCEVVGNRIYYTNSTLPMAMVKGGVELWRMVRVGGYMKFARRGYNSFGLTVSLVINAGKRE